MISVEGDIDLVSVTPISGQRGEANRRDDDQTGEGDGRGSWEDDCQTREDDGTRPQLAQRWSANLKTIFRPQSLERLSANPKANLRYRDTRDNVLMVVAYL